ncbi:hypothetical protein BO71DRAFT_430143 [Aspergillus ellipticus CBS 707.79]|uniref:Uncharacterized protein n=1 Tax=Aspergillus ellipticus CBS 707.79 TaxID=1448320 RepID=A0A319DJN3_9EURO|nr:hypothetical protein BO71DRAFT_430143 [Aspergillus ellipticus CBS 707.79]
MSYHDLPLLTLPSLRVFPDACHPARGQPWRVSDESLARACLPETSGNCTVAGQLPSSTVRGLLEAYREAPGQPGLHVGVGLGEGDSAKGQASAKGRLSSHALGEGWPAKPILRSITPHHLCNPDGATLRAPASGLDGARIEFPRPTPSPRRPRIRDSRAGTCLLSSTGLQPHAPGHVARAVNGPHFRLMPVT